MRRSKERAEPRVFRPWKESVEEYFYDKSAMYKRAEPHVTEVGLMREIWKGLSPHAPELLVVSWKQYNQKEFRDELIQRHDMVEKSKRRSRYDGDDKRRYSASLRYSTTFLHRYFFTFTLSNNLFIVQGNLSLSYR